MTKEEVIEVIKAYRDNLTNSASNQLNGDIEAFDIAIKALLEKEPCNDWCDVPSNEMTLEQARQAVADLRKKLAEHLEQEPCEDCISFEAVKNTMFMVQRTAFISDNEFHRTMDLLMRLPPVNSQPKTGHWIKISPAGIYECSECGQNVMTSDICAYKFCHGCGAKMVEPKESEEV